MKMGKPAGIQNPVAGYDTHIITRGHRHTERRPAYCRYSVIGGGLDYPLLDITSSGLTHTWGQIREEANQFRMGPLMIEKNSAYYNCTGMIPAWVCAVPFTQLWMAILMTSCRFDTYHHCCCS